MTAKRALTRDKRALREFPPVETAMPACVTEFEPLARARLSQMAWDYFTGGAGDEITVRWNVEAFDRLRLAPRALVDVSSVDSRIRLLGEEMPHPILLAPTAYHKLAHAEGEAATARGASACGATMVVSLFSTVAIEEITRNSQRPVWLQLYMQRDRGITRSIIERVQEAGCRALCLTVDTPILGPRRRELRFALPAGMDLPNVKEAAKGKAGLSHRTPWGEIYSSLLDPALTWKDIAWMRSFAKIPVLLKGVLHPDDAERAAAEGVAGIIVSNHGGRNLDTVPATIEALPRIAERVAGRVPILLDGGIRRGTDILKALALGAQAVLIGRPQLWGLAVAGAEGVASVVNILRRELEMAMALTGHTNVAGIDRGVLWEA